MGRRSGSAWATATGTSSSEIAWGIWSWGKLCGRDTLWGWPTATSLGIWSRETLSAFATASAWGTWSSGTTLDSAKAGASGTATGSEYAHAPPTEEECQRSLRRWRAISSSSSHGAEGTGIPGQRLRVRVVQCGRSPPAQRQRDRVPPRVDYCAKAWSEQLGSSRGYEIVTFWLPKTAW